MKKKFGTKGKVWHIEKFGTQKKVWHNVEKFLELIYKKNNILKKKLHNLYTNTYGNYKKNLIFNDIILQKQ